MTVHLPDGDQAGCRAIAHAAYYAVYHHVVAQLGLDPSNNRVSNHGAVRRELTAWTGDDRGLAEARLHFVSLQRAREAADYNLARDFTRAEADEVVTRAYAVFYAAGVDISI